MTMLYKHFSDFFSIILANKKQDAKLMSVLFECTVGYKMKVPLPGVPG